MPVAARLGCSFCCALQLLSSGCQRWGCEAGPGLTELTGLGSGYKFATPPSPNLEKLLGTPGDVWDQHFIGIMCSPKFEGKTHKEMRQMVEDLCAEVGLPGRVHMICQPPSRWHMMKARTKRRWDFDR
ncbi:unnamed protein product [Cladocopium goreaui]|uniref:Uncharacterized protein n=1 Tax=Cladocopium goreaui TaxID=2562237 RepID=A0A9P1BUF8_9DINO|nr:unnamed protein product [Cladocopium goreaui]